MSMTDAEREAHFNAIHFPPIDRHVEIDIISLRDQIARGACLLMLSRASSDAIESQKEYFANHAYGLADAMLRAREA